MPAGAGRRVARSGRRNPAVVIGRLPHRSRSARASRPDENQAADDQHEHDRRRAHTKLGQPARPAGRSDRRLQLESRCGRARIRQGDRRFFARRSLLRGARALPDRHRRLRRHFAAGNDAARALRHPFVVWSSVLDDQQPGDRPARRIEAQHRSLPAARPADGVLRRRRGRMLSRFGRRPGGRGAGRPSGECRHHARHVEARRMDATRGSAAVRAVREWRIPDGIGQVRVPERTVAAARLRPAAGVPSAA